MSRILIIEDEEAIADLEKDYLELSGFEVEIACQGGEGLKRALEEDFDLVILDLMLPEIDGFEICRQIRDKKNTPIIMVSAKKDDIDKIRGLGLGADDYLTKPCNMERLLARIKSLLRRTEQQQIQHDLLKGNGFLLDPHTFTIYVGKTSYVLPPNEGKILLTLLMNYPRTVSKEELFHALWGTDKFIDENALQVNFTRLRKTMRNYGLDDRIETVRGEGYRLKVQVDI